MPLALASQTRVSSAFLERPPWNAGARSRRPRRGIPVAPERPTTHSAAVPASRRAGRPEAPSPAPRLRGGTPQGRDAGGRAIQGLRAVFASSITPLRSLRLLDASVWAT